MKFIAVDSFTNYIDAHIQLGRLQEAEINCWLKDEAIVTIDPLLTNAVGGIKLMVAENDFKKALELINEFRADRKAKASCPRCSSHNVEYVSTPRKPGNWVSVIIGFFITLFAPPVEKVYHCFDCGHEYNLLEEKDLN